MFLAVSCQPLHTTDRITGNTLQGDILSQSAEQQVQECLIRNKTEGVKQSLEQAQQGLKGAVLQGLEFG